MLLEDEMVVVTKKQLAGRGQMGTYWQSKEGQSLTFSIFKRFEKLSMEAQFGIAMATALGIKKAMIALNIPEITIKWPNDIMSYQKKLGGILIENQTERGFLKSAIIGIGINVNESSFVGLPNATSLFLNCGHTFDLDEVMDKVVSSVLMELNSLKESQLNTLKNEYEASLFRKNKISVFKIVTGEKFNGIIQGVTDNGKLILLLEDDTLKEYDLKEVQLLL